MIVVIAEKPSVAKDIAKCLGASSKCDGYLEGNGYAVTWAFGHLVCLADASTYNEEWRVWSFKALPLFPEEFIYELINDPGVKKQFGVICKLFSSASEIVCATDAGREGEAIFRYIYDLSGCNKPVKRLWISSLTESAIKQGFACLKNGTDYDDLYYSAKCRNEADWLVGINATRALTCATGSKKPLSIGRVQTPTLAIVASRFIENRDFVPKPFFLPDVELSFMGNSFKASVKDARFDLRNECEGLIASIPDRVQLLKMNQSIVNEKPPLPYDLTSLQADANRLFHFKAQETLNIAQSLYETHKVLTYPRTASRYLGTDMVDPIKEKIERLSSAGLGDVANKVVSGLKTGFELFCFDDSKLTDHHAIIPTFENLDEINSLNKNERAIFNMVCLQLIMALCPVCTKKKTAYEFSENIVASGSVMVSEGWRALLNDEPDDDNDGEKERDYVLPSMNEGDWCDVTRKGVKDLLTKKPPLHSEASLLRMMEAAGKMVDDEQQRAAIKDCGIGTPATRAAVIETLKKRGFIEEKGNKVIPTELGLQVYSMVKDMKVSSPSLTGDWELRLNRMAEGKESASLFMGDIKVYTTSVVNEIVQLSAGIQLSKKVVGKCPLCGADLLDGQKSFYCSTWKKDGSGCSFVLWKCMGNKNLSEKDLLTLISGKTTGLIKGFKSKEGKEYSCKLKLVDGKLERVFDNKSSTNNLKKSKHG